MAHDFAAARAAAQHCPELTGHGEARGPRPEERAELLTAWRRDLARALADDLSPLLSDDRLDVTIGEPDLLTGAAALERIGALAANSLLRVGVSGETALLSFDFATALALTDRSFGGEGRVADNAPETLPRSAALMVEEAATMIAQTMTRASYADAPPPVGTDARGEVMIRSENAARLKPFAPDAACQMFTLVIANQQGCTWRASLVVTAERMDRLLPGASRTLRPRADHRPATGTAAPFANVPLSLHAVLAEFDLSLARLQTLSPGDSIPLTMGRQVPLMVGEQVLAFGSIGTADDRMAIRLTRIPVPAFAEGAVS
ncbi:MAG: FliM/FliN family flagellar motor switch protein [Erythrobacter sp.]|nr:FliM/FliN family flagellar motor switch protein [Erythrobacter sp.]